ncbi:MAG: rhombosortase [Pseudomonadota bacterium]
MGLNHWRAAVPGGLRALLPAASVAALAVALWWAGPKLTGLLRFERSAIAAGEVWRLLTGHFVHLGGSHVALNAAGLVLVWLLVGSAFSLTAWLLLSLLVVAAIDAGLWWFSPELSWYVGLSGLLHGWLAAGVCGLARRRRDDAALLGVMLAVKLGFEQWQGPLPGSAVAAGGPVIIDAHLYGAIGGVLAGALALLVRVKGRTRL